MSKRSAEKPSNPVGWEGVGFGLDVPILYPVLSENPAELLRAIAALRPPGGADAVAYAPPVRRGPGRPGWTEALFLKRWHEAESKAAPSDRLAEEELAAIVQARTDAGSYRPIQEHLRQAASLLADRKNPDFRNSVKESMSAVEATCQVIAGERASLGDCLKLLGDRASLHPALRDALSKLYGWTSDAEGIRHALMDTPKLDLDDARFMLVVCSAYVSYLLAKAAPNR